MKNDILQMQKMADELKALARLFEEEEYTGHWYKVIVEFENEARQLIDKGAGPGEATEFANKIQSIYGGMGSFNDTGFEDKIEELKEQLYETANDVKGEAYAAMGNRVYKFTEKQRLKEGEKVTLIKGEVIHIRGDKKTLAPAGELVYEVRATYPDDIDGMPLYFIQADSHCRIARQNALKRVE